jgi:hypothetical protein
MFSLAQMFHRSTEPAITPNRCYQLPFFSVVVVLCHFVSVFARWLGGSFAKLGLAWACAVLQMCHQMRWLFFFVFFLYFFL